MKTRVLMIDDDIVPDEEDSGSYMWYYADELRQRDWHVVETMGPDDALKLLDETQERFDIIVLDVMMPPGKTFSEREEADRGLRTGVCLADEIRSRLPRTPVVVLTNAATKEVLKSLQENPSVKRILFKYDFTPSAFAQEIEDVLMAVS